MFRIPQRPTHVEVGDFPLSGDSAFTSHVFPLSGTASCLHNVLGAPKLKRNTNDESLTAENTDLTIYTTLTSYMKY